MDVKDFPPLPQPIINPFATLLLPQSLNNYFNKPSNSNLLNLNNNNNNNIIISPYEQLRDLKEDVSLAHDDARKNIYTGLLKVKFNFSKFEFFLIS